MVSTCHIPLAAAAVLCCIICCMSSALAAPAACTLGGATFDCTGIRPVMGIPKGAFEPTPTGRPASGVFTTWRAAAAAAADCCCCIRCCCSSTLAMSRAARFEDPTIALWPPSAGRTGVDAAPGPPVRGRNWLGVLAGVWGKTVPRQARLRWRHHYTTLDIVKTVITKDHFISNIC